MPNEIDGYDVAIIGAGIGGLVCGCYLAKSGLKVLVAEQHHKPGGYCTSFKRRGFTFDAAAHSFGSYRNGGNMRSILETLDLDKTLKIIRYVPSDIIITNDYKITFWPDINRTIEELQCAFPHEGENVRKFIQYLTSSKPIDFAALRKKTFQDLLDQYFQDEHLKAILSLPALGNGALPPSLISAFTGSKIFTEFILDGGYYPEGGLQALPDALTEKIRSFGGEVRFSNLVKKIVVKNDAVRGIILEKDGFIPAQYIVSNCDARQTFFKLLGEKIVKASVLNKIKSMIPSLSTFILYLGITEYSKDMPDPGLNLWFMPFYNLEDAYYSIIKGDFNNMGGYMVRLSPDKRTILAFMNAPFKTRHYWERNKTILLESFLKRIEKHTIPGLSNYIAYKEAATPQTLYRYTLNYRGSAYGWASFPSQLFTPELRQSTYINGLYLAGHWTTQTQGIPGVAYLGLDTAKLILKKKRPRI
jgi:phytoene dehydrogenase-like protein